MDSRFFPRIPANIPNGSRFFHMKSQRFPPFPCSGIGGKFQSALKPTLAQSSNKILSHATSEWSQDPTGTWQSASELCTESQFFRVPFSTFFTPPRQRLHPGSHPPHGIVKPCQTSSNRVILHKKYIGLNSVQGLTGFDGV